MLWRFILEIGRVEVASAPILTVLWMESHLGETICPKVVLKRFDFVSVEIVEDTYNFRKALVQERCSFEVDVKSLRGRDGTIVPNSQT